ncbi:MAG: glycosyltransferase family 39 protein [Anaerolineae bacterium]|nr:glycosyltransferase family 39 protein [Anaerolineae bacterium]
MLRQHTFLIVPFIISLIIRLVFLEPLISHNAPEIWDAYNYFDRAVRLETILVGLLRGNLPSVEELASSFSNVHPPMQHFVLSLGFLAFGSTLAVGRVMMVVLSALTTPLVYLVSKKATSERGAVNAAVIFAIYPGFIHYSLRLFSETTYVFILFAMLYFALMSVEVTQPYWKASFLAVVTGFLLGVGVLTRATGLSWIVVVALGAGWYSVELKKRFLLPTLILISAGITLLPWEIVMSRVEGRFVPIVIGSDISLYNGNTPWLPEGYGEAFGVYKEQAARVAREYSQQHNIRLSEAYRTLALKEITGNPTQFLKRGFYKLRDLWSVDHQLVLYILMGGYPPINNQVAGLVFGVIVIGLFAFLALALWGLFNPAPALHYRGLIVSLVLAAIVVHFITLAHSRHNIPLLAVLLPAAGHGGAYLGTLFKRSAGWPWKTAWWLSITLAAFSIYTSLPFTYGRVVPSSHYLGIVRKLDRWLGVETRVSDRVLLKISDGNYPTEVTISTSNSDLKFLDSTSHSFVWQPSSGTAIRDLVVQSQTGTAPFQLYLSSKRPEQTAVLSLNREAWQTWNSSGITGIEYMWTGSAQLNKLWVPALKNIKSSEDSDAE